MEKIEDYKEAVNKLYREVSSFDDPNYIYSLRNTVGFYQRVVILKNLIKILNRNFIRLDEFASILDLGCGIGYWLRILAEIRGNSKDLIGIDLSEERINYARKINKSIKYINEDICYLSFKDKSFDFVTAFTSFMFLTEEDNLKKAVSEVARVLREKGFFLFFDVLGKKSHSQFTRGFSVKEISSLCRKAGFKLVDKQGCYRNIFGIKKYSTAYLPSKIPIEILLLLEKIPISKPNNIFLLFRKER